VVKLLHMKALYRLSNSAFTVILNLLFDAFLEHNMLPKSYSEAKSMLKELVLTQNVHLAPNTQQAEQAGFTRAKSHET
jgi:hypothetical protein